MMNMTIPDTIEEAVYRHLTRPGSRLERSEAPTVRLRPIDLKKLAAITYPCERCDEWDRSTCRHCEGTGNGIACVSEYAVDIEGCRFDRGAESEPRIEAALAMVDEHCREDLERLLRNGPAEDDEPAPHHVKMTYEQLTDSNARPAQAAMSLHDVLVEMMRGAVQDSSAPFLGKIRALARIGADAYHALKKAAR